MVVRSDVEREHLGYQPKPGRMHWASRFGSAMRRALDRNQSEAEMNWRDWAHPGDTPPTFYMTYDEATGGAVAVEAEFKLRRP